MPASKNAFARYILIVRRLKRGNFNHPVSIDRIMDDVREETGYEVSHSTIEKDIAALRHDSVLAIHAPIINVNGYGKGKSGYYIEADWLLSKRIHEVFRV